VLGALGGGLLVQAGLSYRAALLLLAPLLLLLAAATAACRYPPERQALAPSGGVVPLAILRNRGFLVLATISLLGVAAESIVDLWAIIYLREQGAGALAGSFAFALFSGAMVGGRFANAAMLARWGTSATLRSAAAGIALAALLLAIGGAVPSVAGFALLALAVAGVLPTVMSATREHFAGESEAAVNGIVSTTYLGFVIAPPAVGWLAELCGLLPAMVFFLAIVVASLLALVGHVARR
jgi:MFS family permease